MVNIIYHTNDRNDLDPARDRDVLFFKLARSMVMSEEPWGHCKPFIEDNELTGLGALMGIGWRLCLIQRIGSFELAIIVSLLLEA